MPPAHDHPYKQPSRSWFIREISLGNILVAAPLIGALFVAYGKWAVLESTVAAHTQLLQDMQATQSQMADTLTKLTTIVDERTIKDGVDLHNTTHAVTPTSR